VKGTEHDVTFFLALGYAPDFTRTVCKNQYKYTLTISLLVTRCSKCLVFYMQVSDFGQREVFH
jgi:hypothetical protein